MRGGQSSEEIKQKKVIKDGKEIIQKQYKAIECFKVKVG